MSRFRPKMSFQFPMLFVALLFLHSSVASPQGSTSIQGRYMRPSPQGRPDLKCTSSHCPDDKGRDAYRDDKYSDDDYKIAHSPELKANDDRRPADDYNPKPKDDYDSKSDTVDYDRDRYAETKDEYNPKLPLRVDPVNGEDYEMKPAVRDEYEPKPPIVDNSKLKPPIMVNYKPRPAIRDDHNTKPSNNDEYKPKPSVDDDEYDTKSDSDGYRPPVRDGYKPHVTDEDRPPVRDENKPPVRYGYGPPVRDGHRPPVMDGYRPPVRDGYGSPPKDGYKPPVRDGHRPPVRDGHRPPVRDGHRPPVRDGHRPPVGDGHRPPVGDGHRSPVGDGHRPPVGDGYRPPVRDGYRPPVRDGYRPPVRDGYKPPVRDGYKPPFRDDGYELPVRDDGYKPPVGDDGYKPLVKDDGYELPVRDDGYKSSRDDGYKPLVRDDGYEPPTKDGGYEPPVKDDGYNPSVRDDEYKPKPPIRDDEYKPKPPIRDDEYKPKPPIRDDEYKPKPPIRDDEYKPKPPIRDDEYKPKPPARDDYNTKLSENPVPKPPVRVNYKPPSGFPSGYPVKEDDYKVSDGGYDDSKGDDEYKDSYKGDDEKPVPISDDSDCICVPYYQCTDGHIVTDGAGIIDARRKSHSDEELPLDGKFQPPSCGPYHVCCNTPESSTVKPYEHRCGVRNPSGINSRILSPSNKGEADFGEWPWQAAVLKTEGNVNIFQCGGVLIDKYHVLTVAHCVFHLYKYDNYPLKVRLGEWDTQTTNEFLAHEDYKISNIMIHPEYKNSSLWNDVAILRLQDPAQFAPHIDTVCLPKYDENFEGQNCVVTGWGKDSYKGGSFSNIMKEVALQVVGNYNCEEMLRKTRLGSFFQLHEGFVCAGGEHGLDSCKGDGGGPLVCYRKDRSYALAGLVSWGIDCGQPGVPGVYVKVQKYLDWISKCTGLDLQDYWPRH